ncbi:recombinase family protein [Gordonia aichiensis]|uniref:recombinase family protein n=1 Tax=Gordonia aichiensis TaxID=36820 RepID=UPI003266403A
MGAMKRRALIVIRLSRATEATTSPERQLEACETLCQDRGYDVVGIADDIDVSAAVPPFERKKLGAWLTTPQRYDVIVFYRMDRLVRRLADLADLISWGQKHSVKLVSATERFLDLDAPFGDVIALLVAKVAEMELEAIRSRTGSASRHTITAGRWRGGVPPWGYIPEKDGAHHRLVQDVEQVEVIREVVDRVLAHESLRSIAHDLTTRKVLTPRDRFAQLRKRKVHGYQWHSAPLKRALTSSAMLGRVVTRDAVLGADGQPLRDAKGNRVLGPETVVVDETGAPIVRAAPILTKAVFDRVGKELAGRENRKEPTTRSAALLTQVLFCGACGRPGYRLKGGKGRRPRYRCASAQYKDPCGNRTLSLEWADKEVEEKVLGVLGPMERRRRVWFTGNEVTSELAEVREMLTDVELIGTPGYRKGTPQRERLDARIAALTARQTELEQTPVEESGWRYEGTGQTVAEWWAQVDQAERTLWLRQSGIRASWTSQTEAERNRTEVTNFTVDMGVPDLDAETLPGPVAAMAEARAAGGWDGDGWGSISEALAGRYWRDGADADVVDRP